jgi:hypothetical protein
MSGEVAAGLPCEPCMMVKIFGKSGDEHPCTGSAALLVAAPCPCCGPPALPKFCARCGQPIAVDEEWEPYDVTTPTGPGGGTFYLHKTLCKRPYSQRTPHSIRH